MCGVVARSTGGLGSLLLAGVLVGCTGLGPLAGGPGRADLAQLVELEEGVLTDVAVTETSGAGGNWTAVRGTAVLTDDLYREVYLEEAASICGAELAEVQAAQDRVGATGRPILQRTAARGTEVALDYELVAERATAEDDPAEVSDGGWTAVAWGGGFAAGDVPSYDMGFPDSFYDGFADAVLVGSEDFAELCSTAGGEASG